MFFNAPALCRGNNSTEVAFQKTDNSLNFYWNEDYKSGWNASVIAGPGTTFASPAMARADNSTVIATLGPDNSLDFYWNQDGDAGWNKSTISAAGTAFGPPGICRCANFIGNDQIVGYGTIVAAQALNGAFSAFFNLDGTQPWQPVDMINADNSNAFLSAPASYLFGGIVVWLIGQGPGNSIAQFSGTFNRLGGSLTAYPGTVVGTPAAISGADSAALAVAQGSDNSLNFFSFNNTGGAVLQFSTISGPGTTYSAPSIGRGASSTVIAACGISNSLNFFWKYDADKKWSQSAIAGPNTTYSAPALGRTSHNSTVIAAVGSGNQLVFYWNEDGRSGWNPSVIASF
jgi:hypothetical protein